MKYNTDTSVYWVHSRVSVHSPLPFPGNAAILAAISAGETPALPGGSERLHSRQVSILAHWIFYVASLRRCVRPSFCLSHNTDWPRIWAKIFCLTQRRNDATLRAKHYGSCMVGRVTLRCTRRKERRATASASFWSVRPTFMQIGLHPRR